MASSKVELGSLPLGSRFRNHANGWIWIFEERRTLRIERLNGEVTREYAMVFSPNSDELLKASLKKKVLRV